MQKRTEGKKNNEKEEVMRHRIFEQARMKHFSIKLVK